MENLSSEFIITAKTTWILGAGASYDCMGSTDEFGEIEKCIPITNGLMSDIPKELYIALTDLDAKAPIQKGNNSLDYVIKNQIPLLFDWLRSLIFSESKEIASVALDNFRSLIEYLAKTILFKEVKSRLSPLSINGFQYRAVNYLWLASKCYWMKDWSILNFNYDLLLDRAFREISERDYSESQYDIWCELIEDYFKNKEIEIPDRGIYLKLHGSLDAFECLNIECGNYRIPYQIVQKTPYQLIRSGIFEITENLSGNFETKYLIDHLGFEKPLCPVCSLEYHELILPPGENKTKSESEYYNMLFKTAETPLINSDTWLILGYSCPEYDQDCIDLLRNSLNNRLDNKTSIWIISPSASEIAKRLSIELNHPVGSLNTTFTKFVDDMLELTGNKRP